MRDSKSITEAGRCTLSEILFSLGVDLTTSALLELGRAVMRQVRPEQQVLLRRTLLAAIEEAARQAASSEAPADAFMELVSRQEVLDAIAALALASTPSRGVEAELAQLFESIDWVLQTSTRSYSPRRLCLPPAKRCSRPGGPAVPSRRWP